jgi:exonuclease III
LKVHKQNAESSNSINIFHQNIRGLRSKGDGLIHSFEIDIINPHILCLSEHHVFKEELLHLTMNGYLLGSSFFQKYLQRGGVYIFVRADQHFSKIEISHHCKEQDFEICAIQLITKTSNIIILNLYKAPSGDVNEFLRGLDATLKYLYNPKFEFIICGDININYLNENNEKKEVNYLLKTYSLSHTVNFATRIQNYSSTVIDNIFKDSIRLSSSCTSPIVNGLSDHDAQFLTINNITIKSEFNTSETENKKTE